MVERSFATNIPWIFMGLILVLFGLGVLNLYSASGVRQEDGLALQLFYQRQCLWGFIGLLCMIIMNLFDYRSLNHLAIPFMIFSLVLLAMVPIFGKTVSGARRWLDLGLFSVQPSELGKIAVLILSSKLLAKGQGPLKMRELLLVLAAGLPAALMVIVQPDLGSGVNILLILGGLILYRGVDFKILRVLIILIPAVLPAVWFLLHPYQQQRIKTFIDPSTDPKGSGYHIVQSKIAIGSGQIWGKGFLQGTQSQLRFLPEKHTDFAISVFAEEWGFAGVVSVLTLFGIFLYQILIIAREARDKFGSFLAAGVFFYFFWQILVNMGMVVGVMPVVGIPLPFFSYGGSSTIVNFILIGIVINVATRRFTFKKS